MIIRRAISLSVLSGFLLSSGLGCSSVRVESRGATPEELAEAQNHVVMAGEPERRVASKEQPFGGEAPEGMVDIELLVSHSAPDIGDLDLTLHVYDTPTNTTLEVFKDEAFEYRRAGVVGVPNMLARVLRLPTDSVTFYVEIDGQLKGWFRVLVGEARYVHISISDDHVSFSADRDPVGFD